MDALAGYGSDSESDKDNEPSGGGALSGLLTHYSDDSDDNDNGTTNNQNGANGKKPESSSSINGGEYGKDIMAEEKKIDAGVKEAGSDGHPKKRRRRWDNPNEDPISSINIVNVLPPPSLLTISADKDTVNGCRSSDNPFQSSLLFQKDYTTELRQTLSQQLQTQSQGKEISKEKQQLNMKLEQLHDTFQQKNQAPGDTSSASSFAAHLKSQKEFGNPHLLKSIIEHYSLTPLESHVGNSFNGFEYVDRLMSAEEKARIAAANYDAGMGSAMGRGPSSGA
mmetsp:Transcript_6227/g.9838  ORF Transcript_6227/g.9838 Transcript_6227/m.9838 type:complete len:280 (+) Transcript_6227:128-967(+)